VELVDEEQDAAVALLDLGQHGLEALLELAAVLRAGDKRAHSRAKMVLSFSPSGTSPRRMRWARPSTIAVLPTRLADEHGVVLRFTGRSGWCGGSPRRGR